MSTIRHTIENELTVVNTVPATRVTDATPVEGTDLNAAAYTAGSRILLILDAFETNVANTGGTWTVGQSATDGGTYEPANTSGDLSAVPGATPGNTQRVVSILPDPDKPFIRPQFIGADTNAEVDVTANFVLVPRSMV